MRKPCSVLVLWVLVAIGVSAFVPARDTPETAYDESEALPYVGTPMAFRAVPKVVREPSGQILIAPFRLSSMGWPGNRHLDLRVHSVYLPCDSFTILDCSYRC